MKIFSKFLTFVGKLFSSTPGGGFVDDSFTVDAYRRAMGRPTNVDIDVKKLHKIL